jgi:hypothetical protein
MSSVQALAVSDFLNTTNAVISRYYLPLFATGANPKIILAGLPSRESQRHDQA